MKAVKIERIENSKYTGTVHNLELQSDEIYRRNYIETLNLLSWWKVRDDAQRMAQIAEQNKWK